MKSIITTLSMSVATLGATAQEAAPKPNIIYILADDLGIGDVGCYGQRIIHTPHIDSLAARGLQFMQHYSGSTVSAPSRTSLMTGKHTGHTALRGNFVGRREGTTTYDFPLPDSEVTLGEVLKSGGYNTACVGKWGLGSVSDEGSPLKQGFDYFFGYQTHIDAHRAYPPHLFENEAKVELGGKIYGDEMVVGKALDYIDRQANSGPFFLYLATTLPHADILAPHGEVEPFDGKFTEKPYNGGYAKQDKPRATFAAMVTRIDNTVGRVVEMLKQKGIYDNTIVIFTSDNGTHSEGGHDPYFFNSNAGYRGQKRDLYQGGIITPMVVSWPNGIRAGGVTYHRSAFWDFLPTVCDLAGVKVPNDIDGISYLPTLKGEGEQKQHENLYWEFHEMGGKQAVLAGDWKLIRLNIKSGNPRYELYNIASDPHELRNVAREFPAKVSELTKQIDAARTSHSVWFFQQ